MAHSSHHLDSRIRTLGSAISPEISAASDALFAPLHNRPAHSGTVHLDLRYGQDARHRLDVHVPEPAPSGAPVLLFVHGGGFVRGDKNAPGCFYYDNIAAWAVAQGMVAVNMTYRLAPQHAWPAASDDVAAAVAWVRSHIEPFGGNRRRIVLMAHSAGAVHAAGCLARLPEASSRLAGAILISGIYDLQQGPANKAYFGEDTQAYAARSPYEGLLEARVPLQVAVAECDPSSIQRQSALLSMGFLGRRGRLPALAYAIGHNHYTIVHHLGTPDRRLSSQFASFIDSLA